MQKGILLCVIDSSLTSEIVRILYAHAWCILLPDKSLILYTFADNFLQIIHTVFMLSLSLYIQKVLKGSQIEGNSVISKNLFMNNYFNNSLFHFYEFNISIFIWNLINYFYMFQKYLLIFPRSSLSKKKILLVNLISFNPKTHTFEFICAYFEYS